MKLSDILEAILERDFSRSGGKGHNISISRLRLPEQYNKIEYGSIPNRLVYLVDRASFVWFFCIPPAHDKFWQEAPFFFLHIPKTASLSISNAIRAHENIYGFGHMWGRFYPPCARDKLRTIVRNPYDRLVSAYFFMVRGGFNNNPQYLEIRDNFKNFEDWVLNGLDEDLIHLDTTNHVTWQETFLPQYFWLTDETGDKLILKKENIGRFENLQNDCVRLFNTSIDRHDNQSIENKDWRTFYKNPKVKNKVYKLYRKDFQLLNYSMEIAKFYRK